MCTLEIPITEMGYESTTWVLMQGVDQQKGQYNDSKTIMIWL